MGSEARWPLMHAACVRLWDGAHAARFGSREVLEQAQLHSDVRNQNSGYPAGQGRAANGHDKRPRHRCGCWRHRCIYYSSKYTLNTCAFFTCQLDVGKVCLILYIKYRPNGAKGLQEKGKDWNRFSPRASPTPRPLRRAAQARSPSAPGKAQLWLPRPESAFSD